MHGMGGKASEYEEIFSTDLYVNPALKSTKILLL